jgi:peptidoglycan/xylan/chitin deacetylase (PgdA/CDA1 family)/GT2 family glycosyltransferase
MSERPSEAGPARTASADRLRFSVIVCTYQRRDLVVSTLAALGKQTFTGPFEVVVVVDGSTDGTGAAVRALDVPYPLSVIEQPNAGLSRSRNHGAAAARGELLVFLDDDMEADPRLLEELDRSHRDGADVAFGRLPLHSSSPPTILSDAVGRWAESVARSLAKQKRPPSGDQIYCGQISMKREVFDAVGGFDVCFAASGTYGNEDLDIGYRIVARGYRVDFNPNAVSRQYYATPARVNLRQYRQMGHADVAFARKHPDLTAHLFETIRNETREHLKIRDAVLAWPRLAGIAVALLGPVFGRRIDRGRTDARTAWWFFTLRTVQYWRGVHEAGGIPRPQPVRVLCYHSISDLTGDPVLADYGITEPSFRRQIESLRRYGYRFIAARELVAMLQGRGGVPRDAVLVTFDDAYRDFLTGALPVLRQYGIQAVTFAVTRNIGGTNKWDEAVGARRLALLGRDELATCAREGTEIGAHSRTHRMLTTLGPEELRAEIAGSLADLEAAGLGRPTLFAYPGGEHDDSVRSACRAAGIEAAFTTLPGLVSPGDGALSLRRIEIFPADRGIRFRLKIATAGKIPFTRAGLRLALWRRSRRVQERARQRALAQASR